MSRALTTIVLLALAHAAYGQTHFAKTLVLSSTEIPEAYDGCLITVDVYVAPIDPAYGGVQKFTGSTVAGGGIPLIGLEIPNGWMDAGFEAKAVVPRQTIQPTGHPARDVAGPVFGGPEVTVTDELDCTFNLAAGLVQFVD